MLCPHPTTPPVKQSPWGVVPAPHDGPACGRPPTVVHPTARTRLSARRCTSKTFTSRFRPPRLDEVYLEPLLASWHSPASSNRIPLVRSCYFFPRASFPST